MELCKDEPQLFADFMEITERRNCYVHSAGAVSPQYLRVCSAHKVKFPKPLQVGKRLAVDLHYFQHARGILCEIAYKTAQTVVRSSFSDAMQFADDHLNELGVDMLRQKKWRDALMVFEYGANLRSKWTGADESHRRNVAINRAQALIGLGRQKDAIKTVAELDWSACHPRYTLALALLRNDFDRAGSLMASAGISEESYRDWPIFEEFRSTSQFKAEYARLFGHDFEKRAIGKVSAEIATLTENEQAVARTSKS